MPPPKTVAAYAASSLILAAVRKMVILNPSVKAHSRDRKLATPIHTTN